MCEKGKLLRVREASDVTGLSQACWRRWILERKVEVVKLGRAVRIPESEVARIIHEGTVPARAAR